MNRRDATLAIAGTPLLSFFLLGSKNKTFVLEAKSTAVIMVDLQHSILAEKLSPHKATDVIRNANSLVDAFRRRGSTIIFTRTLDDEVVQLPSDTPIPKAAGSPSPEAYDLVPEVHDQHGDIVVTKRQWGAFYRTDLEHQLKSRSIRTIVLGGVAANFGVESTARAAFDRGYELVFAADAISSIGFIAQGIDTKFIFTLMGRVRSTQEILAALTPSPKGSQP